MSREDEIMRGDQGPSIGKIALFIAAIWIAFAVGKTVAGDVGAAAVISFGCGYIAARLEDAFRQKK